MLMFRLVGRSDLRQGSADWLWLPPLQSLPGGMGSALKAHLNSGDELMFCRCSALSLDDVHIVPDPLLRSLVVENSDWVVH